LWIETCLVRIEHPLVEWDLLEMFLPMILAQRVSPGEKVLADPSQRAQLASLLESLSGLLRKGGDL
jgi:hypothetical protein